MSVQPEIRPPNPKSEIALTVIATGNVLMGDDGIGVRIIERLIGEPGGPPPRSTKRIEYLDGSVGGLRLLNWIEQAERLLFVDAAELGGRPGHCRLLTLGDLLDAAGPNPPALFSLHQTDLAGVLRLARQFYRVPPTWLLAIQVESVQPGQVLGPPLAAALPRLARIVQRLSRRLVDQK